MHHSKIGNMFINPSWWVKAYEVSASAKGPHLSPLELSCESGLTPALNPIELGALSIVIANIQRQLLSGAEVIELDPVQHRKFVSSTSRSKIFSFERILQILTGLRLLSGSRSDSFDAIPIFAGESWRRSRVYDGLVIELRLAEMGPELLFGLAEPYREYLRFIGNETRVQRYLYGQGPISLWQSVWLDLQGLEQTMLLRLEKAMQWESRWVSLDGAFACSLEDLFAGLDHSKSRGKSSVWTEFRLRQRTLERFGRKLLEHGILSLEQDSEYIALGQQKDDLSVIWRAAPEYINQLHTLSFYSSAAKYLRDVTYKSMLQDIIKALAGSLFTDALLANLLGVWGEIEDVDIKKDFLGLTQRNNPIMASCLFMEWYIRQLPGHRYPLPEQAPAALRELSRPSGEGLISQRFDEFLQLLIGNGSILRDIENTPGLSLTSSKTQSDSSAYQFFAEVQGVYSKHRGQYHNSTNSRPIQEKSKPVINTKVVAPVATTVPNRAMLKKVAAEELIRIRSEQPAQYADLKKSYIETLDPSKRKIIVEVMERLQPKTFDDHLKNSLIKYMIENSEAWLPPSITQHS